MADVAVASTSTRTFREYEFMAFSVAAFIGKSALLIRLPYRELHVNTFYTVLLLLAFYCYFRFRYKVTPSFVVMFCLAAAVAVDVMGNLFHLYGNHYLGLEYDEFSHFVGSGFSLVPTFWLLRTTTRRFGYYLSLDFLAFLSTAITFSFCAYYEILELWDEKFWGDFQRLWTPQDSANDLQWDLAGIILAALITTFVVKLLDWSAERGRTKNEDLDPQFADGIGRRGE
jgi:hypothetical protein